MGRLFWKFFLCILLAQVAATIGVGGVFWLRDQARQRATPALDSGPPAAIALDAAAATLRHGGLPALRSLLPDMRRPQLFVLDGSRRELLGRAVPADLLREVERELRDGAQSGESAVWRGARRLVGPGGEQYIAFVSRDFGRQIGRRSGAQEGTQYQRGPEPMAPALGPGPRRRIGQSVVIGATVLASLLFAALLAWYFSRPIRALRNAFEAAAAGDLAPRFGPGTRRGDELVDLGRDFDRMSARLRALMDGQRRLLHDVSHELRSPLARMQAALGLAHQQPDKIGITLERIERESNRMDKLIGELLTLSRLEASPDVLRREPLDLVELVDGLVADVRFEAGQAGQAAGGAALRVDFEAEERVGLEGDPDLLWSALENVVRNAARHGAPGGIVTVSVRLVDGVARVDVCDRGPGIAPDDLPAIFQPFFRAGASRTGVDGHGLGLAIAQRVVQAHGGEIVVANRDGGGLRVTITLPSARRC
ncbi:two-component system OmpR family sensor kinase [Massilia sp. MP_M2]|uniref:sensor histidine kinase n=1 Tax=Massilia sp. MP_M2 TaxID=3071713 RepID=UPI00319DB5FC